MEEYHNSYPPFLGPYGPSSIECSCGFRYLTNEEIEGSKSPEALELLSRLVMLRNDHYTDHYVEFPYERIRMSYNPHLNILENVGKIVTDWPEYKDMTDQIEKLVESYQKYVQEDDGFDKVTSDILLDQLDRF